jgi:DMSO/TMAO reductase YedYZ heme-binding membrane subunit
MIWLSRTFRVLLFVPALWVAYKIIFNLLGADPAIELNHDLGQVALYMLISNLLIGILISLAKPCPMPNKHPNKGNP